MIERRAAGPPRLGWYTEPLSYDQKTQFEFKIGQVDTIRKLGPGYFIQLKNKLRSVRPPSLTWASPIMQIEGLDVFGEHPISNLTYKWLSEDLKRANWA